MKQLPGTGLALGLFALSALLAWLTGGSPDTGDTPPSQQRTPAFASAASRRAAEAQAQARAAVARFERDLIYSPAPDTEVHSAAGLEKLIGSCRGFVGEGEAVDSYFGEWARSDPRAAFDWINRRGVSSPIGDFSSLRVARLFEIWADKDLESALAAAPHMAFAGRRAAALYTTLMKLASSDPARARALFTQHLDLFIVDRELYGPYGEDTGAFAFLSTLPPGKARGHLLAEQLGSLFSHSRTKLAQWNSAPDDVKRDLIAAGFMNRYASDSLSPDVEGVTPVFPGMEDLARRHAEDIGDVRIAEEFVRQHGQAWAASDLPAAFAWTRTHLKGQDRLEQSAGLFKAAAAADYDRAVQVWQALPESILKAKAAGALLHGAPEARKPDAQAILETLSSYDRTIAQP